MRPNNRLMHRPGRCRDRELTGGVDDPQSDRHAGKIVIRGEFLGGLAFDEIVASQRRNTEVRLTPRWRNRISNHRSRSCERLLWALPIGNGGTKGGATYRFRPEVRP